MALTQVEFSEFQRNFQPYIDASRKDNRVLKLEAPGDLSIYLVASHAGVNEVLKNDAGHLVHFADYFTSLEQQNPLDKRIAQIFTKNLGNNSGTHIELRKDIRNHFNGGGVDQHIAYIQKTVDELCDQLALTAESNNGRVEIMRDFAMPLTFMVTSHMIGLEFASEAEARLRTEQASRAIQLINLLASDVSKQAALEAHDELSAFILPQLEKFVAHPQTERSDCLFHDFGEHLRHDRDKLDNYIELVNGLFQAGLGATGSFLALCLHLMLVGDEDNRPEDIQAYFRDPVRSDEEKREAVNEYIRVVQTKLGGLLPRYSKTGGPLMGETIAPHSLVYMCFSAANLDDQAFAEPRKINPERTQLPSGLSREALRHRRDNRHEKAVSFSYGEHMCPGRRIALTIIRYAIDQLFTRFPQLRAGEINVISEMFGRPSEVVSFELDLYGR